MSRNLKTGTSYGLVDLLNCAYTIGYHYHWCILRKSGFNHKILMDACKIILISAETYLAAIPLLPTQSILLLLQNHLCHISTVSIVDAKGYSISILSFHCTVPSATATRSYSFWTSDNSAVNFNFQCSFLRCDVPVVYKLQCCSHLFIHFNILLSNSIPKYP